MTKEKKPMGPGLKRFIKKHKRFPKTLAERREAGTMTKKDKARTRSKPTKKKTKKKGGKKHKKTTSKKTKKKGRKKSKGWVF